MDDPAAAGMRCVVPIRIRLVGRPTDEDLVRLEAAVARLVTRQLQAAQRALQAGGPGVGGAEQVRDRYDPAQDQAAAAGYMVASYQHPGAGTRELVPVRARRAPKGGRRRVAGAGGFRGDGKHRPTDTRYAAGLGQADAVKLRAAGSLSSEARADINAKLAWFQADAHEAYLAKVKPALVAVIRPEIDMFDDPAVQMDLLEKRQDAKRSLQDWYNDIRDLKQDLINNVWKPSASQVPPEGFGRKVLMAAISIVALGMGGVVYSLIEDMFSHATDKLLKEFIGLAGLEAGDLAAEKALHWAADAVVANVKAGVAATTQQTALETTFTEKAFAQLLKNSKGSVLDTYVAAMNLQMHMEADNVKQQFIASTAGKSYEELLGMIAVQKLSHDQLLTHPDRFLREMTIGYVRMIDEAYIERKLEQHARTRERTYTRDAGELFLREGEVNLNIDTPHHSIGVWATPDLSFSGFELVAGGMNTQVLQYLAGFRVAELPVMARFTFFAKNPFSGGWTTAGGIDIHFSRDPKGRFYVAGAGEDALEWLASYYTRKKEEHSDEEREKYAPLGAEKLYNAIKDKLVNKVRSVELHEIVDFGDR
jgi:hypothetical protein